MPIDTAFLKELEKVDEPQDYLAPPPKKSATSGINRDFVNSLIVGEHPDVIENKAKTIFDPEGAGYDMESALKYGMKPDPNTGHWASRVPQTGLLLKGRKHKTWDLLEKGEEKAGHRIYKEKDGRYYSMPKTIYATPVEPELPSLSGPQFRTTPRDIRPAEKGLWPDLETIGEAVKIFQDPTTPEGRKLAKENIYDRLKWAATYYASLGGRLGPKGLRKELREEVEEFGGFGPALMPVAGETGTLAIEWGWLYPKLFKLAGVAGSQISRIPKVGKGIRALKSMGGITKVAERYPRLYSAGTKALAAFTKGEVVGQTMAAVESLGKDKPINEWLIDMNKRGALLGGVAATFSVARSIDQHRYITATARHLRLNAYNRHVERVNKGMLPKHSADMARQEGRKIDDVIYYLEQQMLGAPAELYGGKKPELSPQEAAKALAEHGYVLGESGKTARQLSTIRKPQKPTDILLRPEPVTKGTVYTAPRNTYREAYNPNTGQRHIIPEGMKVVLPKGYEISGPISLKPTPAVELLPPIKTAEQFAIFEQELARSTPKEIAQQIPDDVFEAEVAEIQQPEPPTVTEKPPPEVVEKPPEPPPEAITPERRAVVAKPAKELWKMTKTEFDTIAQSVSQKWDTGFKVKSTGKIINTGAIHALPKGYKESSLIPGFINVETGRFFTRQEHKNFVSAAEHQLDQMWRAKKRRGTPWDVHEKEVREAIDEGKPVPRQVLEEYKSETWAQEALAKPTPAEPTVEKPVAKEGMIEREIWGTKEFNEGKQAAIKWGDKVGTVENPYSKNTVAWGAWNRGWNSYEPKPAEGELAELRTELSKLETLAPRMSEGAISATQMNRMGKRQRQQYDKNMARRYEVEAEIRELQKTPEQRAKEVKVAQEKKAAGRLLQIKTQIDMLQRVGIGKRGVIRPSYQKQIDALEVERKQLQAAEPIVAPAEKVAEVKAKVPEGEISRRPVTVEGKKYYPIALPTDQIGIDAAKFQFKLGAKLVGGVTEALKGVEKFDPVKGGQILVWQDKAGKYWVVDGHHRVALAKKTGAETLETWVVSEKDGVTEQDARAIGALRNLADGKGTAVDAAKLFRDSDISLKELRKNAVPTESTVVQQGLDMADLSDEVFRLVIDERLPANMAATIGKQVKNATQQKQVADLILEGEVETLRQAELLAATIDSAPVLTKTEQTLFGLETTEKSLYAERAKVLANVEKKLKTNKKVFGVLATQTGIIEAKGNILAKVENLATKEKAEEVLFMLEKLANSKGPVAEALNDATKQYAENPTKENLSKVTSELLEKWTEGPGRLRVPERERVPELPLERVKPKVKGKPGFIDVRPLEKALKASLKLVEPAKITQRAFGKKPGAIVIKGVHQADVGRIEFNEADIEALDSSLGELGEKLSRYSNKILKNLMASRGKPVDAGAVLVKNEALKALAKEAPELVGLRKMITRIADHNYKYLQSVVGDDIHYVEDYFYGIYKDPDKVERFLDYWKTTKRFTKEKKLPTVADAIAYGLDLRDYNPVKNLRSEYMAIARLDGMIYMRDELMRTGKGRYIDTKEEAPHDWEKIKEPVFKDVRVHPELAVMIKSLLSTNKLRRGWFPRGLTHVNNALRTLKFVGSMFHQLNIAKQSIADEGYLKFLQPSATRGITRGFKKSDPIFRTPAYKDYIKHGGGHRYSIESQAARAVSNFVESLDRRLGMAFKVGALPIRIPKAYVKWLFQSYIPKVKYSKYLDSINRFEEKNNRTPTSAEKIEIIKEQQNFYGMMNERLFGRSGTVTSLMRLWYMSPGYFEGNLRTILKSILQWGGKEGFRANRSRSNIINSLILSGIVATATTLILIGKPPKKPETLEDVRDLFKGDTGKVDDKGRKIMIDFLTYDKDYWNLLGNVFIGKPDEAAKAAIKRGAGMVAPTAQIALDVANMAAGRALVDWKNDRVTEVTDPFARKVLKIAIHEIKRIEPISVSVYGQSRRRDQTVVLSALTSLLGVRPTLTEKDKREQEVLHRMYSLAGQKEELDYHLSSIAQPRKTVDKYNKLVRSILDSPMTPPAMKAKWEKKLIIDIEKRLENKAYTLGGATQKPEDIDRAVKYLKNFGVTQDEIENYIRRRRAREIKRTPISPLDRDRVMGLIRRIRRAKERMKK